MVSKRKNKKLSVKEYEKLQKHYRNILTRGEKEMPPIPEKPKGHRGKIAKSDAHNLLERLRQHESAVLLFAKMAEVPFTNNRAERDLRMSKVKQKVSGCFRTERYAKAYCRISSYIQTMSVKGYNPLAAIEMAISGEIYNTTVWAVTLNLLVDKSLGNDLDLGNCSHPETFFKKYLTGF